jgi:hypothetical protein
MLPTADIELDIACWVKLVSGDRLEPLPLLCPVLLELPLLLLLLLLLGRFLPLAQPATSLTTDLGRRPITATVLRSPIYPRFATDNDHDNPEVLDDSEDHESILSFNHPHLAIS